MKYSDAPLLASSSDRDIAPASASSSTAQLSQVAAGY
jgi:hypothetical protein